jgi:hypothetical protein
MTVIPNNTSLWDHIKCFIGLHSYKLILKLHSTKINLNSMSVPYEAYEICKVCGQERNNIKGFIEPAMERSMNVRKSNR